jgi:proteasome lid subunit RPN8/RPN11
MTLAWRDTSPPIASHPLPSLADAHGLATALEAVAASRDAALCVVMPRALRAQVGDFLAGHAVEAGGLLLGWRYLLGDHGATPLVSVERFVPGRVFEGTGVSLALGTALWDDARPLLDAGLVVVGWVHSHPDLGAFFSGTDRRTQRAFFAQPWQFGLCIDPVRGEEAWFHGADSRGEGLRTVAC